MAGQVDSKLVQAVHFKGQVGQVRLHLHRRTAREMTDLYLLKASL